MGTADKAENKIDELAGKAKVAAGDATDDKDLQAEGHVQQAGANAKQAGEDVKDALRAASNAVKGDDLRD
jgi:uncharacterized protein YjbJ (UPF0337 family)